MKRSVRAVTNEDGAVVARYDYDPYGKPRLTWHSGELDPLTYQPIQFDFLYTGHLYHAKSGLYFAPFRAYDPELGRWISRDPIDINGGINLYGYVEGDPVNYVDPLGLTGETDEKGTNKVVRNPIGKVWNSPNTVVGLGWGGINVLLGESCPKWNNEAQAFEFNKAPLMGDPGNAMTLGNVIVYSDSGQ